MMYLSIFHWLPIANGYSSYPPRTYLDLVRPRRVVFERRHVPTDRRPAYERRLRQALRPVRDFGGMIVYEVPST